MPWAKAGDEPAHRDRFRQKRRKNTSSRGAADEARSADRRGAHGQVSGPGRDGDQETGGMAAGGRCSLSEV